MVILKAGSKFESFLVLLSVNIVNWVIRRNLGMAACRVPGIAALFSEEQNRLFFPSLSQLLCGCVFLT